MRRNYEKPCITVMLMQPLSICDDSVTGGSNGGGRPAEMPRFESQDMFTTSSKNFKDTNWDDKEQQTMADD